MNSARIIIPWTLGALGAGIALAGALGIAASQGNSLATRSGVTNQA